MHVWKTRPATLLGANPSGCPRCAGNAPLTIEEVDCRLAKKNVDRLSAWHNGATPLAIGCTICYYGFNETNDEWVVIPSNILNNSSRCPNCSGLARITNEEFDRRIKDRNIERMSDVNGVSHNIDFLCTKDECGYRWNTAPTVILQGHGCPKCSWRQNHRLAFDTFNGAGIAVDGEKYLNTLADIDTRYHVDFYLPEYNAIIEYNGRQHYEPVCFHYDDTMERATARFLNYQLPRDAFVRNFCAEHNIRLIVIDGRAYINSKLKDYILNEIIPSLAVPVIKTD